jgi:hypothetical protein
VDVQTLTLFESTSGSPSPSLSQKAIPNVTVPLPFFAHWYSSQMPKSDSSPCCCSAEILLENFRSPLILLSFTCGRESKISVSPPRSNSDAKVKNVPSSSGRIPHRLGKLFAGAKYRDLSLETCLSLHIRFCHGSEEAYASTLNRSALRILRLTSVPGI